MVEIDLQSQPLTFKPMPAQPPPLITFGPVGWLRDNLFNGWFNSFLTIVCLTFLGFVIPPVISWLILDATWTGDSDTCRQASGACWTFIGHKFQVFFVGTYPASEVWRPAMSGLFLTLLSLASAFRLFGKKVMLCLWILFPFIMFWLINGGLGLPHVDQSRWGGLMLSIGLALVGIIVSIPVGIFLALGRRSPIVTVKSLCIGIIEPIRGVPLITILFMASVMMPLFLPEDMQINNMLRVQVGIIMFSSAYMAEVVRGGLQAIPQGQIDAARAVGLNYWKMNMLIVLPQALRHVLPSLIGRCIALFKDTSLVIIVGLLDFLGMAKAATQDSNWLGYDAEAYIFCAAVYWIICFSMSRYGRSIELSGPRQT